MTSRRRFTALLGAQAIASTATGKVRIGCQTRSYGNPPKDSATLLPLLDDIKAAGYEGFETNQVVLGSIADPARLKPELGRRVPLIGLHLGVKWQTAQDVEKSRAEIERVAAGTVALGGTHLMLSGAADTAEAIVRKTAVLNQSARDCRQIGLRLCVHNHESEARHDFAELRALLSATKPDDLSLLLDAGHAALAGANAAAFLREHVARIAGFHIRDRVGPRQVPMGAGQVDLKGIAAAIRETGWSGWLIVELEGEPIPGVSNPQNVRAARAYIREQLKF